MKPTPGLRRTLLGALLLSLMVAAPVWSWAQSWPAKPIKLIVPFPPGGATDILARVLADKLPAKLGQPVIVENKPGASTVIGVTAVAKAAPDGYTVLVSAGSSFAVLPALKPKLPFDIEKDFAPVSLSVTTPLVLVTSADKPYARLADLIAQASSKAKSVRYSSYGPGTSPQLASEILADTARIDIEPIPFKGSSDALMALVRGDVDMGLETIAAAAPLIKSGKLRALAVTSPGRSAFLPGVPGLDELKLSAAAFEAFYAVALPAGTPKAVVDSLSRAVAEVLADTDVKEKFSAQSLDVVAGGPEALAALMARDIARFRAIGKRLNIELD
ncbi:MAG: hypothetical protein RLZZ401_1379 [Pseudomonadota bacterium]|jgi:tripartite-type tricarboxylate transporter receptor subunit TctC